MLSKKILAGFETSLYISQMQQPEKTPEINPRPHETPTTPTRAPEIIPIRPDRTDPQRPREPGVEPIPPPNIEPPKDI